MGVPPLLAIALTNNLTPLSTVQIFPDVREMQVDIPFYFYTHTNSNMKPPQLPHSSISELVFQVLS